jgi:hypothetical protein
MVEKGWGDFLYGEVMSEQFRVGEIVILKNDRAVTPPQLLRFEGEEVEIVGPLGFYECDIGRIHAYVVRHMSGMGLLAEPHELRRRKPPTTGEQSILAMFRDVPEVVSV